MVNQAVLEKQNLVTALVSQLNDFLVLVTDRAGLICSWHPTVNDRLGYLPADIIGQPLRQIVIATESLLPLVIDTAESKPAFDLNWVATKSSGRILMRGISLELNDALGNPAGSALILRSVELGSNSLINSRALEAALEHSNVLITGWNGTIQHWNEGCERLYGFTAAEAIGQLLDELLKTEYPVPLGQIENLLAVEGIWRGELKQRRKNGKSVFVSAQLVKLEPNPGHAPLIVATHSDITPRLEMQHELESANARLKRMADELERSNEELEEFARIASHDLSAPITSTRWLVDLLTSRHGSQLDADGQKALAQVAVSLERMADLVEAVLAHAKVGKGPIGAFEAADTELAVEVALENLRRDVITSGAKIIYSTLPPLLIGQQPLTQLFQNLLSNAIKYRRPDTALKIQIRAEQSGVLWRVAVEDNGMGLEPEWFERIFLPMQRRHSSKISGSGIGLATCRKIVNRAGGRIWVESAVGEGSTFFFTLPGAPESVQEPGLATLQDSP